MQIDDKELQEQIEFNKTWWANVQEGEPISQDEIDEVLSLLSTVEGLKGKVERLKEENVSLEGGCVHAGMEIDALRQQVEKYRTALEEIAKFNKGEALVYVTQIKEISRKALGES